MANSPERLPENRIEFRAPPPSPVASGRRSSVRNDEILTEFLEHSLRVPDLILPDRVFPKQNSIQNPPILDLQSLNSMENESIVEILDKIARIGCFELVNHGIPRDLIRSALTAGAGIFELSPENKTKALRSQERPYGFEEFHGEREEEEEEEREIGGEEFVWCKDEKLKLEMEGIWPLEYSKFSQKMERLLQDMENMASKFLQVLHQHNGLKHTSANGGVLSGSACYIYKHSRRKSDDNSPADSLRYDVIRMLVRGSEYSHALCLHLCQGSSEFHVYSKKGWVSFCPDKDAVVITIGDQLQEWTCGKYKHVIGRPIYRNEEEEQISMAFMYSPQKFNYQYGKRNEEKTISVGQQTMIAILLTLVFHLFIYFCKKF